VSSPDWLRNLADGSENGLIILALEYAVCSVYFFFSTATGFASRVSSSMREDISVTCFLLMIICLPIMAIVAFFLDRKKGSL
jgi:hypothetical protein